MAEGREIPTLTPEETLDLVKSLNLTKLEADKKGIKTLGYSPDISLVCVLHNRARAKLIGPLRQSIAIVPVHESLDFYGEFNMAYTGLTHYFTIPRDSRRITYIRTSNNLTRVHRMALEGYLFIADQDQVREHFPRVLDFQKQERKSRLQRLGEKIFPRLWTP